MKHSFFSRVTVGVILCLALTLESCGFIIWNDHDETVDSGLVTADSDTSAVTGGVSGGETTAPVVPDEPEDLREAARERLAELPSRSFGSSNVLIITVDPVSIAPSGETESETVTARMVAARAVEEKFGTHIIASVTDAASMLEAAKAAYAADMYYADLLAVPVSMVGAFKAAGILMNLNSLPFTDYTKPYYDREMIGEAVLGNGLWAASGAANLNPDYLSCVYFNRSLADELKLGDLYKAVDSGEWTWDKLNEYALAARSIDGVGGLVSGLSVNGFIDTASRAMNIDYVTSVKGQAPTLDFMKDDALSALASGIVEKLYDLIYKSSAVLDAGAEESFVSGGALFYVGRLDRITPMSDAAASWGILPLPKYGESQREYITPLSSDAPVFCALSNTPDYDKPGLILEGLMAASHGYLNETYLGEMTNYRLRDSGSIGTLRLVLEGASVDFTQLFASGIEGLENATYGAIRRAVTTSASLTAAYNSYAAAAERALAESAGAY